MDQLCRLSCSTINSIEFCISGVRYRKFCISLTSLSVGRRVVSMSSMEE